MQKPKSKINKHTTTKIPLINVPNVKESVRDITKTTVLKSNQILVNDESITINMKEMVGFFKALACGRVRYGRSPHGASVHLAAILEMSKDEAKAFMANFKS